MATALNPLIGYMPAAALGSFLTLIAPPLGLGSVQLADGHWVAYGMRGNVFRADADLTHWAKAEVPAPISLFNHALAPDGALLLTGQGGTVLRSTDGGATFTRARGGGRAAITELAFAADGSREVLGLDVGVNAGERSQVVESRGLLGGHRGGGVLVGIVHGLDVQCFVPVLVHAQQPGAGGADKAHKEDHGHAAALICSCSFPTTTFFVTAFWKKEGHKSSFVIFKIVWLHLLCPKNAAAFHGQPAAKAMVPSHSSWPGAITIIFSNLFSLKPFGF